MALASLIRHVEVLDTSVTTGAGLTGKVYSDFTAKYCIDGGTLVSLTTETITTLGTYQAPTSSAHIRIKELNSADPTKGMYEVHFHNTQLATGTKLWLYMSVTGGKAQRLELDLVDVKPVNLTQIGGDAQSVTDLKDFADVGYDPVSHKVAEVAVLTGHTAQTGNSYAIVNSGTHGNAALKTLIDAVSSSITGLNNLSALANLYGSPLLEIPDSGDPDADYAFTLVVRDNEGKLVALDGSPTITAANAAGTDRSANLSAVSNPAAGRYTFTYSVADDATPESLRITCSGAVSAEARYVEWVGAVVDYDTLTTLLAVKAKTDNLPAAPASTGDVTGARDQVLTRLGTPADTDLATDIAAVKTDTGNLVTRISSTLFAGITSLAQWLGAMAGKQTPNSTAQTEMRATGAGSGTYDATTDSDEARAEAIAEIAAGTLTAASKAKLDRSAGAILTGTVGVGSTTTTIVTSALSVAGTAASQLNGRIVIFDDSTTTAALRGQATDITSITVAALPVITVTALTTAPASTDTFTIT